MRKIHMLGIFLILLASGLFVMCDWFEIGIGPGQQTILHQSYGSFDIWACFVDLDIAWYVSVPLSLIALIGLICIVWPPRQVANRTHS
jgi:hypothetical protein